MHTTEKHSNKVAGVGGSPPFYFGHFLIWLVVELFNCGAKLCYKKCQQGLAQIYDVFLFKILCKLAKVF